MTRKRGTASRSSSLKRRERLSHNYSWKVLPVLYKEQIDESSEAVRTWLLNQEVLETRTQTILENNGIPNEEWPHYFAFARRVLQKALDFTSDTLEDEKASLKTEWLLRGKDETTIDQIIAAMQTLAAEIKAGGS